VIRIGITERHGIADEYANYPPKGIEYSFVKPTPHLVDKFITSSAKGIYNYFDHDNIDLYEAPIFPILTKKNWLYTPAEYSGTANFGLWGLPIPRSFRLIAIEKLLERSNFKKLIFKSNAGMDTLFTYGKCQSHNIIDKATVVYPAIQLRREEAFTNESPKQLLFSGDFFRKGGANVVDVFIQLQTEFPKLKLRLCCAEHLHTSNTKLRDEYLRKINSNKNITFGLVSRKEMLTDILPNTDVFLSPTYQETFGFAILEAMSFGIPVISTNIFAIPEIIDNNKDGILLDIRNEDFIKSSKGYGIDSLCKDFHDYTNDQLYSALKKMLKDPKHRLSLSSNAIDKCKNKFSPEKRAIVMSKIYQNI